jgi:hypothetical protein
MDRDGLVAELYSAPLEGFVAARKEIAARVKPESPELAAEISKVRKPSLPLWSIAKLARDDERVARLVDVGTRLRAALSDGDQTAIQELGKKRRALITELRAAASEDLAGAGHGAGATTLDRISTTLLVASADEEAADLLRKGILDREMRSSDAEDFGPFGAVPVEQSEEELAAEAKARRAKSERAQRDEVERLEREASRLELEAEDAAAHAERARTKAERARAAADEAAARLTGGAG